MDIRPTSSTKIVAALPADAAGAGEPKESDAEILAWARKRGVITFFFFFSIACLIAIVWTLTR